MLRFPLSPFYSGGFAQFAGNRYEPMKPTAPSTQVLLAIYGGLMSLLVLTALASFARLGAWQMPVALIIAAAKTTLVFLFFMQLRYQRGLVRVFAVAGFFWLAIIGVLTFADYLTRGWRL